MSSTPEDDKPSYGVLFCAALFVVAVIVGAGYLLMNAFGDWAQSGVFGDSFGVVNALFSGLAFAGIIFTIFLQQNELRLQRHELKLQRDELELTRGEISRSADAQIEQSKKLSRNNALQKKLLAEQVTSNRLLIIEARVRAYAALQPGPGAAHYEPELRALAKELEDFVPTNTKGIDAVLNKERDE